MNPHESEECISISIKTIRLIFDALGAPTHDPNDYNCEDWLPGHGCSGCTGDELRHQALKALCQATRLSSQEAA